MLLLERLEVVLERRMVRVAACPAEARRRGVTVRVGVSDPVRQL